LSFIECPPGSLSSGGSVASGAPEDSLDGGRVKPDAARREMAMQPRRPPIIAITLVDADDVRRRAPTG
jgi:hypothetical protein